MIIHGPVIYTGLSRGVAHKYNINFQKLSEQIHVSIILIATHLNPNNNSIPLTENRALISNMKLYDQLEGLKNLVFDIITS